MAFENASAGQEPRATARGTLFAHRIEQKTILSAVVGLILAVLVLPPLYL